MSSSGFLAIGILLLILAGAYLFIRAVFAILRDAFSSPAGVNDPDMTAEDESYAHSGPYGYSPNTAYPETQYGSGFNPDAEWAERTDYDEDHHH